MYATLLCVFRFAVFLLRILLLQCWLILAWPMASNANLMMPALMMHVEMTQSALDYQTDQTQYMYLEYVEYFLQSKTKADLG